MFLTRITLWIGSVLLFPASVFLELSVICLSWKLWEPPSCLSVIVAMVKCRLPEVSKCGKCFQTGVISWFRRREQVQKSPIIYLTPLHILPDTTTYRQWMGCEWYGVPLGCPTIQKRRQESQYIFQFCWFSGLFLPFFPCKWGQTRKSFATLQFLVYNAEIFFCELLQPKSLSG